MCDRERPGPSENQAMLRSEKCGEEREPIARASSFATNHDISHFIKFFPYQSNNHEVSDKNWS